MQYKPKFIHLVIIATALLTACATKPEGMATQATTIQVPSLKVALDCGVCQVRPTVPALIVDGYNAAAIKAGAVISTTKVAIVTIKEYSDRNDAARFLVGIFAGKDEIKATVATGEKNFSVEDYYRNAWLGIESLAKSIGEKIFDQTKN